MKPADKYSRRMLHRGCGAGDLRMAAAGLCRGDLAVLLLFAVSRGVAAVVGWAPNTQGKSLEQIEVERYGAVIDAKLGERAAAKV